MINPHPKNSGDGPRNLTYSPPDPGASKDPTRWACKRFPDKGHRMACIQHAAEWINLNKNRTSEKLLGGWDRNIYENGLLAYLKTLGCANLNICISWACTKLLSIMRTPLTRLTGDASCASSSTPGMRFQNLLKNLSLPPTFCI